MPNKIKLPPIPPGQKYKGLVIKFILATAFCFVIFSLATLLFWFLGIITSSLIFDTKDFSLEFTKNVIHGGVIFAVLILFFAIGNCLVIAFRYWRNEKLKKLNKGKWSNADLHKFYEVCDGEIEK